jgi:hypothetical protein
MYVMHACMCAFMLCYIMNVCIQVRIYVHECMYVFMFYVCVCIMCESVRSCTYVYMYVLKMQV